MTESARARVRACWVSIALAALLLAFGGAVSEARESAAKPRRPDKPSVGASQRENVLFGFSHLLPSPYTLPAGRLALGTEIAFGVTDFLQVGTNILRDFYKILNANARMSVIDFPEFAFAFTYGYERYNLHDIDRRNPNLTVSSHQPGAVTAFGLLDDLALFVGGNLNFTNTTLVTSGVKTSGFVRGAQVGADLSWAYSHTQRKYGNVLSPGATYDLNYKVYGIGLSHHWPGFRLGAHYYPNAKENRLLPLISGGAVVDL